LKILSPFFPFFIVISKVLDSSDFEDWTLIAGYFLKMAKYLEESSSTRNQQFTFSETLSYGLDTSLYFLKNLNRFFYIFGA
jgi:hypothetical protein